MYSYSHCLPLCVPCFLTKAHTARRWEMEGLQVLKMFERLQQRRGAMSGEPLLELDMHTSDPEHPDQRDFQAAWQRERGDKVYASVERGHVILRDRPTRNIVQITRVLRSGLLLRLSGGYHSSLS